LENETERQALIQTDSRELIFKLTECRYGVCPGSAPALHIDNLVALAWL
jgi:hypothetical protein